MNHLPPGVDRGIFRMEICPLTSALREHDIGTVEKTNIMRIKPLITLYQDCLEVNLSFIEQLSVSIFSIRGFF